MGGEEAAKGHLTQADMAPYSRDGGAAWGRAIAEALTPQSDLGLPTFPQDDEGPSL